MASKARQNAPNRNTLTPRKVVEAALELAGNQGIESVTIRKLAKVLGVTPMALYWHFRNKDELLDAIVARVFEEIEPSVNASSSWQDQLRALLGSLLGVLRTYPAAAGLISTRTATSESGLRTTELLLEILARGGFSPSEATQIARHALSTVSNLVSGEPGVVLREDSETLNDFRQSARLLLESLPPEHYPRLIEAAKPLSEGIDPETYFNFGLDLLLDGIEATADRKRQDQESIPTQQEV